MPTTVPPMPYFVNLAERRVIVRSPGASAAEGEIEIDRDTALDAGIRTGQILTDEQIDALRRRSIDDYRKAGGEVPLPAARLPIGSSGVDLRAHAHRIASVVETLAWCLMVLGIVFGLVALLQVRDTLDEFGTGTERPYVGTGLTLIVGSVFNCLLVVMVAAYIRYRTDASADED